MCMNSFERNVYALHFFYFTTALLENKKNEKSRNDSLKGGN